ncbi:MAG: LysR family transcriptional regulator [Betaproteobacteria bacterium]|nr:LysR family transcriptional regulator [Betaproteobacteria bacterium]
MNRGRRPRLSLELLKGFEAAARHLSFTRAAAELFVTQSAISRGIKTLEHQLGRPLFIRVDRGLELTDAGRTLLQAVGDALQIIDEATGRLSRERARHELTVTTNVATASLWLVPRLLRFNRSHPDVNVRVLATNKVVNLERERVDVAIRHFPPESRLPEANPLVIERVFPVCSPALARERSLASPADLSNHVLLQFETYTSLGPWLDWTRWLEAMNLAALVPVGVLRFSHYDQVIQAALDGIGVALGRHPLVADHLRNGRLVTPFGGRGVISGNLYMVAARGSEDRGFVRAFMDWLRAEVRSDDDEAPDPSVIPMRPTSPARSRRR